MKPPTLAEQHQQAAEIALEHFRRSVLLTFGAMSAGLAQRYRKQAWAIVRFFEDETDENVWKALAAIPDPETGGSLADAWLQSWQRMRQAVK